LIPRAKNAPGAGPLNSVTVLTLLTLVSMILLRDQVRTGYLDGIYTPENFPLQPQYFNITLFALLLASGVVTLVWILRKLAQAW